MTTHKWAVVNEQAFFFSFFCAFLSSRFPFPFLPPLFFCPWFLGFQDFFLGSDSKRNLPLSWFLSLFIAAISWICVCSLFLSFFDRTKLSLLPVVCFVNTIFESQSFSENETAPPKKKSPLLIGNWCVLYEWKGHLHRFHTLLLSLSLFFHLMGDLTFF